MEAVLAALGLVFIAELGDKTQLIAVGFGARHRAGPVLVGLTLGYALSNAVAVFVGGVAGASMPTDVLGLAGGVMFLVFAGFGLRQALAGDDTVGTGGSDGAGQRDVGGSTFPIIRTVATMIFIAELGDKTQLATATLASQANPVLVWIGATIGIILAGACGVVVGRAVGARLPRRTVGVASAGLFAAFGVALIALNV